MPRFLQRAPETETELEREAKPEEALQPELQASTATSHSANLETGSPGAARSAAPSTGWGGGPVQRACACGSCASCSAREVQRELDGEGGPRELEAEQRAKQVQQVSEDDKGTRLAGGPPSGDGDGDGKPRSGRAEAPVQAACAACTRCEVSGCASPGDEVQLEAIQLWDCSEYREPSCSLQSEADGSVAGVGRPAVIHSAARRGLAGASTPLPHFDRIQTAFGRHDISDIRTRVGGAAHSASREMGARAFASGSRIGFRSSPGVRLAAHEAAHVVQQRDGLSLPDNIGRPGDHYERHADRVADVVASGRSAEVVLDEVATRGAERPSSSPVQTEGSAGREGELIQRALVGPPTRHVEAAAAETPGVGESASFEPIGCGEASEAGGAGAAGAGEVTAKGDANEPPPNPGQAAKSKPGGKNKGSPGTINTPCFGGRAPKRPKSAKKPKKDKKPNTQKQEESTTFPSWGRPVDECEAQKALKKEEGKVPAPVDDSKRSRDQGQAKPEGSAEGGAKAASVDNRGETGKSEGKTSDPAAGIASRIGQAEGSRDAAVIDFVGVSSGLGLISTRAARVSEGIDFSRRGGEPETAADSRRRMAAADVAKVFLQRGAAHISKAISFVQADAAQRLSSAASTTIANIEGAMQAERAAISQTIAGAQKRVRGRASGARALLITQYVVSVAKVQSETSTAIAKLDAAHKRTMARAIKSEGEGLSEVTSRFATGRKTLEMMGPKWAGLAVARGQAHAHGYETNGCKKGYKDDGLFDGCLTVRQAHAQQKAACKTAAGYQKGLVRQANQKAYNLRHQRKQYRCMVISGGQQVRKSLDGMHGALVDGLRSGCKQALAGMAVAMTKSSAGIDKAEAEAIQTLVAQGHSQRQAINDVGYMKQLAAQELAHASAASLGHGVRAAMGTLESSLHRMRTEIIGGVAPDPTAFAADLGPVESALTGGVGALMDVLEIGVRGGESSVARTAEAALTGLSGISTKNEELAGKVETGFSDGMAKLEGGTTGVFQKLTSTHVKAAKRASVEGVQGMVGTAKGFEASIAKTYLKIDAALKKSVVELRGELDKTLGELDVAVPWHAWEAAKKEQPAWKEVLAIVLIILVIIAATLVTVFTLGAGASLFAVILVGALVGAVSAGLIQIINNWSEGKELGEGVVTAMIMGAIGGAIGGGMGFAAGTFAAAAGPMMRAAITLGGDLAAEALTQGIGVTFFSQEWNPLGFVMAGGMSGMASMRSARGGRPRAGAPKAGTPEVGAPKMGAPDVAAPKTGAPDVAAPKTGAPDVAAPKTGAPDVAAPKTGAPDVAAPKTGAPDVAAPKTGAPDVAAPKTGAPDVAAPKTGAPDVAAPKTGAPDVAAPKTGGPEVAAPKTGAPDAAGPKTGAPDAGAPKTGAPGGGQAAGVAGARRAAVRDAAGNLMFGFGLAGVSELMGGKFDAKRFFSTAASAAAGSWAAGRANRSEAPKPTAEPSSTAASSPGPSTRLGRMRERVRKVEKGIENRLSLAGERMFAPKVDGADAGGTPGPRVADADGGAAPSRVTDGDGGTPPLVRAADVDGVAPGIRPADADAGPLPLVRAADVDGVGPGIRPADADAGTLPLKSVDGPTLYGPKGEVLSGPRPVVDGPTLYGPKGEVLSGPRPVVDSPTLYGPKGEVLSGPRPVVDSPTLYGSKGEVLSGPRPVVDSPTLYGSKGEVLARRARGPGDPEGIGPRTGSESGEGQFRAGGAADNEVGPTKYNPECRGNNCGFTAISRALEQHRPDIPFKSAEVLYAETRSRLKVDPGAMLSHELVFPQHSYDGLKSRRGYEPMFEGTRSIGQYTVPAVARASGLDVKVVTDLMTDYLRGFGPANKRVHLDDLIERTYQRMELNYTSSRGRRPLSPTYERAENAVMRIREELAGDYIVGSVGGSHFMNVTIDADGRIRGFDPQDGRYFDGFEPLIGRMNNHPIDMWVKVSAPKVEPVAAGGTRGASDGGVPGATRGAREMDASSQPKSGGGSEPTDFKTGGAKNKDPVDGAPSSREPTPDTDLAAAIAGKISARRAGSVPEEGGAVSAEGSGQSLNLGAGSNPMRGAVNVDLKAGPGVAAADASALPFDTGTFAEVHAVNPFGFNPVSAETARVMQPGGLLRVSGTARNPFAQPVSPAVARAAGFEIVETTPLQDIHNFGVQRTSSGAQLKTSTSTTTVYRRLP